jgi:2-polyprenyl-6-hydroxyphenyl methylase/3-demethylubiquinone-9 3-methyltransferase
MARLGFSVTGVDPSEGVEIARAHAAPQGLAIDYRAATVEDLLAAGEAAFDVVLAMEVVEHVAEPGAFLADCARLVAGGGLMIVATLNRTLKSLALGKVAAEYLLRWAPPGTHDWRQFLKPGEVRAFLESAGLEAAGPFGLVFDPLNGHWRLSADADINFMMTGVRAG